MVAEMSNANVAHLLVVSILIVLVFCEAKAEW